jgi:hypothetical protein
MTVVQNSVPLPLNDPIARTKRPEYWGKGEKADPQEGGLTDAFIAFFTQFGLTLEGAPARVASVALTGQSASIGATDMSSGGLSAGLYEFAWYARITQAATTSSSLTVTLDWTDGGVSPSFSGAAITGNTVTTFQSETKLIRIDSLSPVRYSTVYSSSGATPMQYALYVTLTEVQA